MLEQMQSSRRDAAQQFWAGLAEALERACNRFYDWFFGLMDRFGRYPIRLEALERELRTAT